MMKKTLALLACLAAFTLPSFAQVNLEIMLDDAQYLADEPIIARIKISNFTGRPLEFGNDNEWIDLNIETVEGKVVLQRRHPELTGVFKIESSYAATRKVNITPAFELTEVGKYRIAASLRIPGYPGAFSAKSPRFSIISGTKLWENTFGVPGVAGSPPETRKYILQQANQTRGLNLYCRIIEAAEGKTLKVLQIGPVISFSKPEAQVDQNSNLHILYQTGAKTFDYSMINPDGLMLGRETHDYTATRPLLVVNEEGHIAVRGGVRRRTSRDLPPEEVASARAATQQDEKTPAKP